MAHGVVHSPRPLHLFPLTTAAVHFSSLSLIMVIAWQSHHSTESNISPIFITRQYSAHLVVSVVVHACVDMFHSLHRVRVRNECPWLHRFFNEQNAVTK